MRGWHAACRRLPPAFRPAGRLCHLATVVPPLPNCLAAGAHGCTQEEGPHAARQGGSVAVAALITLSSYYCGSFSAWLGRQGHGSR